jgi:hypothetical protein
MTDDKMQPKVDERYPEQAKPEQVGQQGQQSQPSPPNAAAQPGQRAAPGRRPLFRT